MKWTNIIFIVLVVTHSIVCQTKAPDSKYLTACSERNWHFSGYNLLADYLDLYSQRRIDIELNLTQQFTFKVPIFNSQINAPLVFQSTNDIVVEFREEQTFIVSPPPSHLRIDYLDDNFVELFNDEQIFEFILNENFKKFNFNLTYLELMQCRQQRNISDARIQGILYNREERRFVIFRDWLYYYVEAEFLDTALKYEPDEKQIFKLRSYLRKMQIKYYLPYSNQILIYSTSNSDEYIFFDSAMSVKHFDHNAPTNVTEFSSNISDTIPHFYFGLKGIVYGILFNQYVLFYDSYYILTEQLNGSSPFFGKYQLYDEINLSYKVEYVFCADDKLYFVFDLGDYLVGLMENFDRTHNGSYKLKPFQMSYEGQRLRPLLLHPTADLIEKNSDPPLILVLIIVGAISAIIFILFVINSVRFLRKRHRIALISKKNTKPSSVQATSVFPISAALRNKTRYPELLFSNISQLKALTNKRPVIPPTLIKTNKIKITNQLRQKLLALKSNWSDSNEQADQQTESTSQDKSGLVSVKSRSHILDRKILPKHNTKKRHSRRH